MDVFKAFLLGFAIGFIVKRFGLPAPMPEAFVGIVIIIGIYVGYKL